MSYGPNFPDQFRRVGDYVDKILRGANPADIPVEQPTKFDLVINLTTAKALGIEVPPMLLIELAAWQPLLFAPGTQQHHSNIGFNLAGIIAEKATGDDLA